MVLVEIVRGRTKTPNAPSPYPALGKLYASSCRLVENHCGWLATVKHHGYFSWELLASIIVAISRRGLFGNSYCSGKIAVKCY